MLGVVFALLTATPATVNQIIPKAVCGDTVQLATGIYARVDLNTKPACTVAIDISAATINWLYASNASNFDIEGAKTGLITGGQPETVQIRQSDHISIRGVEFMNWSNQGAAISTLNSNHLDIGGNEFAHSQGDATDLVSTQFVRVHDNRYWDLNYVNGENHTDALQVWSVVGLTPSSNIEADHNDINCACQGLDDNGTAGMPTETDMSFHDNLIATTMTEAVQLANCSARCSLVNNTARTAYGMPIGWGGAQVKSIATPGGEAATFTGNVNGANPTH